MSEELVRKFDGLERKVAKLDDDVHVIKTNQAVLNVQFDTIKSMLTDLKGGIFKVLFIVIAGFVGAGVTFVVQGGLVGIGH